MIVAALWPSGLAEAWMVTKKRKRRKLKDQTESPESVHRASPVPPPDLATLPEDLHFNRELSFTRAAANRFSCWLAEHIARERIPLDEVMIPVKLLNLFVFESLLARVRWPHLFVVEGYDEGEDAFWTPQNEADAMDAGLTVRRVRRGEERPPVNLPGCAGFSGTCPRFRRYGERFCPKCRRAELERMRG